MSVFESVEPWLGDVIMLGVDDTLARKRGLKIFGVGMHHDPLRSTRSRPVTSWGLSWVSLGVIVRLPFRPDHSYYLPLLFRLYQNKTAAAKSRRTYHHGLSWRSSFSTCSATTEETAVFIWSATAPVAMLIYSLVIIELCPRGLSSLAAC